MSDILLLSMLVGLLYAYIQERSLHFVQRDALRLVNGVNTDSEALSLTNTVNGDTAIPKPPDGGGFFSLFSRGFTLFYIITTITEIMGERLITEIDGFMEAVPKITGAVLVIYAVLEGKRKVKEITAGKNAGRWLPLFIPKLLPSQLLRLNLFCNRCVIPPDISENEPSKED